MGKMIAALILAVVIEIGLNLFATSGATETSLTTFIKNPQDWSLTSLIDLVSNDVILGIIGSTAIVAGLLFFSRENALYASFAIVALGFGILLSRLWAFIYSQNIFGDSNILIASLICLPLLIFYLISILDYARKPD